MKLRGQLLLAHLPAGLRAANFFRSKSMNEATASIYYENKVCQKSHINPHREVGCCMVRGDCIYSTRAHNRQYVPYQRKYRPVLVRVQYEYCGGIFLLYCFFVRFIFQYRRNHLDPILNISFWGCALQYYRMQWTVVMYQYQQVPIPNA